MNHRISAGAIVIDKGRILLVRHRKEGSYDFRVAPGGGAIDTEDIFQAAMRCGPCSRSPALARHA